MRKTGIFYSFRSIKTRHQVQKMIKHWGSDQISEVDVETTNGNELLQFDNLILAVPTWFDGELPYYWDELLPDLEDKSFKGKKVAIFGGGNQLEYPENFVDGIGIMADFLIKRGASLVGFTSAKGYHFESSKALRKNNFCGLAIDIENQAALTDERIIAWIEQLKKEMEA